MSFCSKLVSHTTSNYGIGIIRNQQLHLSPIKSVYQMRRDFNHCNPNIVESEDDNQSIINCQIIHDTVNNDLYFANNAHQTRQFMPLSLESNKNDKKTEQKYSNFHQIPPGISRNEALSLPLIQSACYYLSECIVLSAMQILIQFKCINDESNSLTVIEQISFFGHLIGHCFVCKHKFLRDSSLKLYETEWNLLIALFYKNKNRQIDKQSFVSIIGQNNIKHNVVNKMLHLLATKNEKTNLWHLKHSNNEQNKMSINILTKIKSKATKSMNKMITNLNIGNNAIDNEMKNESIEDKIRQSSEYVACSKFVVQKLKKNKVLSSAVLNKLIAKYSKSYPILTKVSDQIMQIIKDDFFWIIDNEKFCLKEIEELNQMKHFNQHRKKIIDWFNNEKKEKIKESMARKQWKQLIEPNDDICQIIMNSICDWNANKKCWILKSGKKKK